MSVTQTGRQHYPAPTLGRAFWALYKNAPGVIQAEASSLLRGANQRMTDAPDLWGDSYTDAVMTRYIKRRIKTYADVQ
ncbi:MAG: hypothetical protein LBR76_01805, partial [Oscillospiraceae bacterium]|nr:hypothetical protein [Oscillospiraceae bacterium]